MGCGAQCFGLKVDSARAKERQREAGREYGRPPTDEALSEARKAAGKPTTNSSTSADLELSEPARQARDDVGKALGMSGIPDM